MKGTLPRLRVLRHRRSPLARARVNPSAYCCKHAAHSPGDATTVAPSLAALTAAEALPLLSALRELLQDAVAGGAAVGFLPPLGDAEADEYWAGVVAALRDGSRVLLVARAAAGALVGTVQLDLPTRANGRHRAEVARLLVDVTVGRSSAV